MLKTLDLIIMSMLFLVDSPPRDLTRLIPTRNKDS